MGATELLVAGVGAYALWRGGDLTRLRDQLNGGSSAAQQSLAPAPGSGYGDITPTPNPRPGKRDGVTNTSVASRAQGPEATYSAEFGRQVGAARPYEPGVTTATTAAGARMIFAGYDYNGRAAVWRTFNTGLNVRIPWDTAPPGDIDGDSILERVQGGVDRAAGVVFAPERWVADRILDGVGAVSGWVRGLWPSNDEGASW
jgi:hypothetical protein